MNRQFIACMSCSPARVAVREIRKQAAEIDAAARGHRSGNRRVETGAPAADAAWKTRPSGSSAGLPSRCANLARLKWPTAPAFS